MTSEIRLNVLYILTLAAGFVIALALIAGVNEALWSLGGAVVGAIGATCKELVNPGGPDPGEIAANIMSNNDKNCNCDGKGKE